jgi:hypothetical protein
VIVTEERKANAERKLLFEADGGSIINVQLGAGHTCSAPAIRVRSGPLDRGGRHVLCAGLAVPEVATLAAERDGPLTTDLE